MQNIYAGVAEPTINSSEPNEVIQHVVTIKSIENVTHDVVCIQTDKPLNYTFSPGQATEVSINKPGWQNEKRSFTFTSLPDDEKLEFTIKVYAAHNGVTNQLLQLKKDDELILSDVFGTITYSGEGIFIAGGAGVTPFISIFKQLHGTNNISSSKLICANKTKADIILEEYFSELLGSNFINILSGQISEDYEYGYISEEFLLKHISNFNQKFYLCGPEPMMEAVEKQLINLQVSQHSIIKEQF